MHGEIVMEVMYSEKDQHAIDKAFEVLRDYEESLLYRLRKDGLNWAATDQEIQRAFLEDQHRNLLVDAICDRQKAMIPTYIFAQQ